MTEESTEGAPEGAARPADWQKALDELEHGLRQASQAVSLLRDSLATRDPDPAAPETPPAPPTGGVTETSVDVEPPPPVEPANSNGLEAAPPSAVEAAAPPPAAAPPQPEGGRTTFDRLWDRIEQERQEREESREEEGQAQPARRGLDLLPQHYMMTIEDREGSIDLVPLHRAFLTLPGVEEVSLVTYANGVPVISVRTEGELDLELLGENVGMSMDRHCEVIPQDNGRVYLRMKAREEREGSDG